MAPVTPREVVRDQVEKDLLPALRPLGFTFSASTIRLSRTVGYARQTIDFSIDRYSTRDDISFWTTWTVTSPAYGRWYAKEWGAKSLNNALGGDRDWNLPGWRNPRRTGQFDLSNPARRQREMAVLRRNALAVGVPRLDRISTWEGAAEVILEDESAGGSDMYEKACDFFLIAGRPDRAAHALEVGLRAISALESGVARAQHAEQRAELLRRRKRHFARR